MPLEFDSPNIEAFVSLLTEHQARLSNFLHALVPDDHAVQDLLQRTNLVLWRKSQDYEPGTNFWAWASRIAYYETLRYRRSMHREKLVFNDDILEKICQVAERRSLGQESRRRALRSCLEKLPQRQREFIRQRYTESVSLGTIGGRFGVTANAVGKVLQRARVSLLECIERAVAQEQAS